MAAFRDNQAGVLIINFGGEVVCDQYAFTLSQEGGGTREFVSVRNGRGASDPAILPLVPGNYTIQRVRCIRGGIHPAPLSGVDAWYEPASIAAGDVVYLGALSTTRFQMRVTSDIGDVTRALTLDWAPATVTYLEYSWAEDSSVRAKVAAYDADLAARMVFRPPTQVLSSQEYRATLASAHSPDEQGTYPTQAEVLNRIAETLGVEREPVSVKDPLAPDWMPGRLAPYQPYVEMPVPGPIVIYM